MAKEEEFGFGDVGCVGRRGIDGGLDVGVEGEGFDGEVDVGRGGGMVL